MPPTRANPPHSSDYQISYPPPSTPHVISTPYNLNFNRIIFLPLTRLFKNYPVLPVTVPLTTQSYYVDRQYDNQGVDLLDKKGCDLGHRDRDLVGTQNTMVILDFGRPVEQNGQSGVWTLRSVFIPLDDPNSNDVIDMVYSFAHAYDVCTGTDTTSKITLVIGTSNEDNTETPEDYITELNGRKFGSMIISARNRLATDNIGQVDLAGASDLELSFSDPTDTKNWVNGINSVLYDWNFNRPIHRFYNYGSAEGCPTEYYPDYSAEWKASFNNACGSQKFPEWTAENIYDISTCATCLVFPEIYSTSTLHATQWQSLSYYSSNIHLRKLPFYGVLTQKVACDQKLIRYGSAYVDGTICNNPDDAYRKFFSALNAYPDTAQSLTWSSDIEYIYDVP